VLEAAVVLVACAAGVVRPRGDAVGVEHLNATPVEVVMHEKTFINRAVQHRLSAPALLHISHPFALVHCAIGEHHLAMAAALEVSPEPGVFASPRKGELTEAMGWS
jgi:hypothetical protein